MWRCDLVVIVIHESMRHMTLEIKKMVIVYATQRHETPTGEINQFRKNSKDRLRSIYIRKWALTHMGKVVLTLCILMDFPIHLDTISMGLPIVYFKGSRVEFSRLWCISVPEGCLTLKKQCRP